MTDFGLLIKTQQPFLVLLKWVLYSFIIAVALGSHLRKLLPSVLSVV